MKATPLLVLAAGVAACGAPVVKPGAFDPDVLERESLVSVLRSAPEDEIELEPGPTWNDVDPRERPTFVGLRGGEGAPEGVLFCLVREWDPAEDRLVLAPLRSGTTPLDAMDDLEGAVAEGEEIHLSWRRAMDEKLLGPPLPKPRHVFAVAANYPSHLRHDLRVDLGPEERQALSDARARIFLKHPATAPPGYATAAELGFDGVLGPFDGIHHPAEIYVPAGEDGTQALKLRLDYEVEIGAVIRRELTPELVAGMTDAEIRAAVAGYVLISDAKARNPQVVNRVRKAGRKATPDSEPYRPVDPDLAKLLGSWDAETCAWWSYAASFGNFAAVGPFFVAAPEDGSFPARAMITARTYAEKEERGLAAPEGRAADRFYLRQCSLATEDPTHADGLIWPLPRIVRSILADDGVLSFRDGDARIARGDVISLGTPGGTVITAKKGFPTFRFLLFWWLPRDWHDAFFEGDAGLYLRNGDEVFYWVEGLGFQRHEVVERASAEG